VTLLEIDGDEVKLGVDTQHDDKVFKEELLEETRNTNKEALSSPTISFDLSKTHENS